MNADLPNVDSLIVDAPNAKSPGDDMGRVGDGIGRMVWGVGRGWDGKGLG